MRVDPSPAFRNPRRDWFILGLGLLIAAAILGAVLYATAGCIDMPGAGGRCARVLFIGNSYTYVNDLPAVFTRLAASGGHKVKTITQASGGQTLAGHAADPATAQILTSDAWNFVVLQEQSQIPSSERARVQSMVPAARQLVNLVEAAHARPVFFLTWAHRAGWPEEGLPDYERMQDGINAGYMGLARETGAAVAPVGVAWRFALRRDPALDLWQPDGSHPSMPGTYLAACVFYAALFGESPVGLPYDAGLPAEIVSELQAVAAEIVLENPDQWNLP